MSIRDISLFVVSASITIIIELLVLYIEKVRDKRLWLSIPINIFTNFVFNLILFFIPILWAYILTIIIGEIIIFFIEWFLYQLIVKDKKNYLYSLTANLSSLVIGTIIVHLIYLVI